MSNIAPKTEPSHPAALAYDGPAAPIHGTLYGGAKNPWPIQRHDFGSFDDVVHSLSGMLAFEARRLDAMPDESARDHGKRVKEGLLYFGPYRLKPETSRLDVNVEHLTLLVSDLDRCDLLDVGARLQALGLGAFIYGSPSDDAAGPDDARRVRVVCPVSRPIAPSECAFTRLAFAEALGLAPGCGADGVPPPSIGFFVGRLPDTPERVCERIEGAPVNVDALMSRTLVHEWGKHGAEQRADRPRVDRSPMPPIGELDPQDEPVLEVLKRLHSEPGGDSLRRNHLRATGGHLARRGYTDERIAALVSRLDLLRTPEKAVRQAVECAREWRSGNPKAASIKALKEFNPEAAAELDAVTVPAWLVQYNARRDARAAAAEAPAVEPKNDNEAKPDYPYPILGRIVDWSAKPKPLNYLIKGLPFAGGGKCNAIQGAPNAAKSPFALLLALCVALGGDFLGRRVRKPGPVLYLDGETGTLAETRFHRLCHDRRVAPTSVPVEFRHVEVTFTDLFVAALESWLRDSPRRLVVIDTYGALLGAEIDNNSPQFAHWLRRLGRLSLALDVVIVVLIHEKKGKGSGLEMIAGNYQGAGAFQAAVELARTGDGNEAPIQVSCARAPEQTFKPFEIVWEDTDPHEIQDDEGETHVVWQGFRAGVVDAAAPPVSAAALDADQQKRAKVARQILEALTRAPSQARTKVLRHIEGLEWKAREKLFGEMVELGLVVKAVTGTRMSRHGVQEEIVVYLAADQTTPAAAEARLKLGLVVP